MKALMALLCLLPFTCGAVQIHTCTTTPTATTNAILGCPKANVIWGPRAATDLVRMADATGQHWRAFNTLNPTTLVYPQTGVWTALGALKITLPAVAIPTTHVYVLSWAEVTKAVDGSAVTDLIGYRVQSGPSATGPWSSPQTLAGLTATYTLPSNMQQCFQVVAVSKGAGESLPAGICSAPLPPTAIPTAPNNLHVY